MDTDDPIAPEEGSPLPVPPSSPRSAPARGEDVTVRLLLDQFKLLTSRVDQLAKNGEATNRALSAAHGELKAAATLLRELVGQLDPLMERHALVTRALSKIETSLRASIDALTRPRR